LKTKETKAENGEKRAQRGGKSMQTKELARLNVRALTKGELWGDTPTPGVLHKECGFA
jgi:hypothetical protein